MPGDDSKLFRNFEVKYNHNNLMRRNSYYSLLNKNTNLHGNHTIIRSSSGLHLISNDIPEEQRLFSLQQEVSNGTYSHNFLHHPKNHPDLNIDEELVRNGRYRKSAIRSFRKWMSKKFKSSKSTPDCFASVPDGDSGLDTPTSSGRRFGYTIPCLSGIHNLGTTCYLNAVLQCLSATDLLAEYLVTEKFVRDLQDQTLAQQLGRKRFGTDGDVTRGLALFLQKLWLNLVDEKDSRDFKALVGRFSAEYRNERQQDAQEFLVWLLDKVHEDLNTATKRTYRQSIKTKGSEENLADDARNNHRRAHCSFITNLFEGQFRSSVFCPQCHTVKLNFDPYMCISLPVPQEFVNF